MPTSPADYNFEVFCGTYQPEVFTFYQPDGVTPQNLTGYGFVLAAKINPTDSAIAKEWSTGNGLAVNGGSNGQITVNFANSNTGGIAVDQMTYVAYLVDPSARPLPPSFEGVLNFSQATLPSGG